MDKHHIVEQIVATLTEELERYARSAHSAHAEATNDQSKAENKYDTRGLEASYLARGQSRQAAEVLQALQRYQALTVRRFEKDEPIDVGAVVELKQKTKRIVYFVGVGAGGTELTFAGEPLLVITPHSPIGLQLIGRKEGEELQIAIGGIAETYRIAAVR